MIDEAFKTKIEALIPRGLDDIIRKNREHCQIRQATEDDLKPLLGEVAAAYPKLVITNWHLVTVAISTGEQKTVLLGDICDGTGNTWITSKVVKLDLENGYLLTHSGSLYLMVEKGEGEPSFEQLALLCSYFNRGGYGAFFGVPEFF
ncbi:MAG TPA: hypothetical protein VIO56_01060 [Methylotenera sp.]|jgi:hypothetical protein